MFYKYLNLPVCCKFYNTIYSDSFYTHMIEYNLLNMRGL